MVVAKDKLGLDWQGLKTEDLDKYLNLIKENKLFKTRGLMELDENYKQIIPYLVFEYNNKLFLMQRSAGASEKRLESKFSLGIGGHIRAEDIGSQDISDWAKREFNEEISYSGNLKIKLLGLINDDSNSVGKVHMGVVFLLTGDSANIKIKSELQSGELIDKLTCETFSNKMESWSKLVFKYLNN